LIFGGITAAITFTGVFALIEFVNYLHHFAHTLGEIPVEFIILRILCVFIHFLYLTIQVAGFVLYQQKKQARYAIMGFITAFIMHVIWNTGAFLDIYKLLE
jgi:RsiW-degrading membrane proteinase PrsW (M82 family)